MILDAHMYADPCRVLEEKQNATCKRKAKCGKCIHYLTLVIGFEVHHGCELKRRNWMACTEFETKGE